MSKWRNLGRERTSELFVLAYLMACGAALLVTLLLTN